MDQREQFAKLLQNRRWYDIMTALRGMDVAISSGREATLAMQLKKVTAARFRHIVGIENTSMCNITTQPFGAGRKHTKSLMKGLPKPGWWHHYIDHAIWAAEAIAYLYPEYGGEMRELLAFLRWLFEAVWDDERQ